MSKESPAFRTFKESYFGSLHPRERLDGPNVAVLRRLEPDERARAEQLLLERLEGGSADERVVIGLGELRSKRAADVIRQRLPEPGRPIAAWPRGKSDQVLTICGALWKIEKSPAALRWVTRIVTEEANYFDRNRAAVALWDFPCREASEALRQALLDDEMLVRMNAMRSLLIIHGRWPDKLNFPPLAKRVASKDPQARRQAVDEALSLIADSELPRRGPPA